MPTFEELYIKLEVENSLLKTQLEILKLKNAFIEACIEDARKNWSSLGPQIAMIRLIHDLKVGKILPKE